MATYAISKKTIAATSRLYDVFASVWGGVSRISSCMYNMRAAENSLCLSHAQQVIVQHCSSILHCPSAAEDVPSHSMPFTSVTSSQAKGPASGGSIELLKSSL